MGGTPVGLGVPGVRGAVGSCDDDGEAVVVEFKSTVLVDGADVVCETTHWMPAAMMRKGNTVGMRSRAVTPQFLP